tara:strand:+ start:238 stop:468 length:231 start_codon:yes stop_codon:yes gene_type:complete
MANSTTRFPYITKYSSAKRASNKQRGGIKTLVKKENKDTLSTYFKAIIERLKNKKNAAIELEAATPVIPKPPFMAK